MLRATGTILCMTLAMLTAGPAFGQCDVDLLEHYGGAAARVARSADRTYAVFGDELFVYDTPGGASVPLELGSVLAPGDHFWAVAASGDYAYVAARNSGLIVVDATSGSSPFVAATMPFVDAPNLIAYENDHVFLCEDIGGSHDVFIVDVSNPAVPALVATYAPAAAYVGQLQVQDGTLYLSTHSGVQIVDVSTPAAPSWITTYFFGIPFLDMDVGGDTLVAVRRDFPVIDVADISNPAAPTAQSLIGAGSLSSIALNNAGGLLFVSESGTDIWDVSTPTAPTLRGDIPVSMVDQQAANTRILMAGSSGWLEQWNAADPNNPVRDWLVTREPIRPSDLAAGSDRLVVTEADRLRVYDTSQPGAAVELPGLTYVGDFLQDVDLAGDIVCLLVDDELVLIDLDAPGGAAEVGSAVTLELGTAVACSADYALVGQLGSLVEVFDISDPTQPTSLGSVDLDPVSPPNTGSVRYIALLGNHACVSTFGDTYIVSFTNPAAPQIEHEFNVVDPPVEIAVQEGVLCLSNHDLLQVDLYDLSSPPIPMLVGSYDETILTPTALAADDDVLAIFDDSQQFSEIIFVDISDPAAPTALARVDANPDCARLDFSGDRLWRLGGATIYPNTGVWELTRPGFDAIAPADDVAVCPGGNATFSISATGISSYQWRRDGVPLTNGLTGNGSLIVGAFSDTLQIFSTDPADQGDYDCVLDNACGTAIPPAARLIVCQGCVADTNCDCRIDLSDLATLLANFGLPSGATVAQGDTDGDGDVDLADLATLLAVYGTQCS